MDTQVSGERGGIQVIARAAAVLRALSGEAAGLSLGEIAARVTLPRSTVQRIVAALVDERFLIAASMRSRVKLGPALLELASVTDAGTEQIARPFLEALSREADETVDLSVLENDALLFVDQVQGTQRLVAVSAIGKQFPPYCTANGKALLALLGPQRRETLLTGRLKRFTPHTITDKSALEAELREVEETGLAHDLEEHSIGICAVGTAFLDPAGRAYAISIPVPAHRFRPKRQLLAKLLKRTRGELLARLHGTRITA